MSGLNPTGPSQPPLDKVYDTAGNPATKEPAQQARASQPHNEPLVDQRIPQQQTTSIDQATFSSLGRGVRGAGPGEDASKLTDQEMGRSADVDAQQMRAPGEGEVASAVKDQYSQGTGGVQPGLETDLDRKKAEQASARQAMKEEQKREVDVGGVLGQRGGPANPVDKGGYPNTGS